MPVDDVDMGFLIVDLGHMTREDPIGWTHIQDGTLSIGSGGDTTVMYLNPLYIPDEDLEGTGADGFVAVANVPPGEVRVRAEGPAGPCEGNLQGWDFEPGEAAVAPIAAGVSTYFALDCPME